MIRDPTVVNAHALSDDGLCEPTVTQNSMVRDSENVVEDRSSRIKDAPRCLMTRAKGSGVLADTQHADGVGLAGNAHRRTGDDDHTGQYTTPR